jgi:Inner membrane protein YgaP-like, transmembrane domain
MFTVTHRTLQQETKMFKSANVGTVDRLLRLGLGALLVALPFLTSLELWANPIARYGITAVGAILILTALVRFCPAYVLVGANTCGRQD